jgi:hypothetical protein
MITSNGGKVELKGPMNIVMADYSVIKTSLEEKMIKAGHNPQEAFEQIEISRSFSRMRKSGMDVESIVDVLFASKSEEEKAQMLERFKRADKKAEELKNEIK